MHGKDNLMSTVKTLPFVIVFTVRLPHDFDLFFPSQLLQTNHCHCVLLHQYYFPRPVHKNDNYIYCFIIHKSVINKS